MITILGCNVPIHGFLSTHTFHFIFSVFSIPGAYNAQVQLIALNSLHFLFGSVSLLDFYKLFSAEILSFLTMKGLVCNRIS